MTNKTHSFPEWFKQLELLAKKMGVSLYPTSKFYIKYAYYENGNTPEEALAEDLE